jgi:hypothetical protein
MKVWREQPEHNYWQAAITAADRARVWWGLAAVCGLMAWYDFRHPEHPPFSGKWSMLKTMLYSNFGANGIPTFECAVALAMFAFGFLVLCDRRKPKTGV